MTRHKKSMITLRGKAANRLPEIEFKHFFDYAEVEALSRRLALGRPSLIELGAIGQSREGRSIRLLTITDRGTGAAADKPAYLIHGNIHASELSGTHAALFTARQLLADYPRSDLLKRMAFYIVPRLNPDGAEFAVKTSGVIRSRLDRAERRANALYQADIDHNGLVLAMRQAHPDGMFVSDPKERRLMLRRTHADKPPFYRLFPEGLIHDWDGSDAITTGGRVFDWNRNWSYDWCPEPEQPGSGDYPFSEPEMRALGEFIHGHANIFGVLGYHNGPAAMLRPPSTGAISDLPAKDNEVMEELARIGARHTGFPVYPVIKYHRHFMPDHNLRGHSLDFAYHHIGVFAFEIELGNLLNSAGMDTETQFKVNSRLESELLLRRLMQWWDRQKKRDPIFMPWTPFRHPQLGRVEIGGLLTRHLDGPTLNDLRRIAGATYRFTCEHAARHPWVRIEDVCVADMGAGIYRVRARIANRGAWPTHVSHKGRGLRRMQPVRVTFRPAQGVQLLSRAGHMDIGHLAGLVGSRDAEWFLKVSSGNRSLGEIQVCGGPGGNCTVGIKAQ